MEMAEIGATPSGGVHRLALSDEDRGARDLFRSWCDAAGLETTIDTLGNMLARRTGTEDDAAPVLIGSHLDSQPMGGRFDGTLGVLAALEVVETLNDEGVTTRHPIEVVNWTNEEGSRFSPAMVCSGVFAGVFELDYALQLADANGFTMGDELERIGYTGCWIYFPAKGEVWAPKTNPMKNETTPANVEPELKLHFPVLDRSNPDHVTPALCEPHGLYIDTLWNKNRILKTQKYQTCVKQYGKSYG